MPGNRPKPPWWSLASYRRRCLAVLLPFSVALLLVATLGHRQLTLLGQRAAEQAQIQHQGIVALDDGIARLNRVHVETLAHLLQPGMRSDEPLATTRAGLDSALRRLAEDADDEDFSAWLLQAKAALDNEIEGLLAPTPSSAPDPQPPSMAGEGFADPGRPLEPGYRGNGRYPPDSLDSAFAQLQRRLETRRATLAAYAADITGAQSTASRWTGQILALALGVTVLLGLVGFVSLDRLVLRPLRTLATDLRDHPRRPLETAGSPVSVDETRDLLDAFAAMQHEVRAREDALDHLAHHDLLTGLPNRTLFRSRLADAIVEGQRHGMLAGVLFMDLNRFKQINDSYGHAAGDRMLVEIGDRLKRIFRAEDTIARLGGDEFAIILEGLHDRTEMTRLAHKTLAAMQRPFTIGERVFHAGATLGIAVAPDDGSDPDDLIQLADAAMHAAKQDDGVGFRYVDAELNRRAAAQHRLENELRDAIDAQRLQLYFQPIIAVADGGLHCYEALLRWPHDQHGVLKPEAFMDLLADAGLCRSISDWVLDELVSNRPSADAAVSFNLSARLLQDATFAERILVRIDDELPADRLIIEITEDTLTSDLDAAARVLHRLKGRGVRVALDDFGTGQASLSHLRRFPFDYLKIDRTFVTGIGEVADDEKLIQAIIGLAHALEIGVVAEGVETEAQRHFLVTHGCDYLQGYLIGQPTARGTYRAAGI
jgi:diguanylate cyclase (GGDEF)-like protein